mmetsp:Transcript_4307/g.9307  ORF Transcript_4307/g.9307 Transcript_4307/m.9307 type:complete len:277 (+) Transcript_4307:193-1023(+)
MGVVAGVRTPREHAGFVGLLNDASRSAHALLSAEPDCGVAPPAGATGVNGLNGLGAAFGVPPTAVALAVLGGGGAIAAAAAAAAAFVVVVAAAAAVLLVLLFVAAAAAVLVLVVAAAAVGGGRGASGWDGGGGIESDGVSHETGDSSVARVSSAVVFLAPRPGLRSECFGRGIALRPAGGTTAGGFDVLVGATTGDGSGGGEKASPQTLLAPHPALALFKAPAVAVVPAVAVAAPVVGLVVFTLRTSGGCPAEEKAVGAASHEQAREGFGKLEPLM